MRFKMPEMCTSSYGRPLEIFLSFFVYFWSPAPHLKCFASGGRICIFLDRDKTQGFGGAALGALLLVVSSMEATSTRSIQASQGSTARPKPHWLREVLHPEGECKLFPPAVLYGKSRVGKGITGLSSLLAVELDCSDCGHDLQTPQPQAGASKFS